MNHEKRTKDQNPAPGAEPATGKAFEAEMSHTRAAKFTGKVSQPSDLAVFAQWWAEYQQKMKQAFQAVPAAFAAQGQG